MGNDGRARSPGRPIPSAITGRQKLADGRDIPHGERARWMPLYRTLEKGGKTVAALWRARRKKGVAKRYIGEANGQLGVPIPRPSTVAACRPRRIT
jgi:hypothetical protein